MAVEIALLGHVRPVADQMSLDSEGNSDSAYLPRIRRMHAPRNALRRPPYVRSDTRIQERARRLRSREATRNSSISSLSVCAVSDVTNHAPADASNIASAARRHEITAL